MSKNLQIAYDETTRHLQELYAKRDQLNVQIDDVMAMRGVLNRVLVADAQADYEAQKAAEAAKAAEANQMREKPSV